MSHHTIDVATKCPHSKYDVERSNDVLPHPRPWLETAKSHRAPDHRGSDASGSDADPSAPSDKWRRIPEHAGRFLLDVLAASRQCGLCVVRRLYPRPC